MFKDYYRILGIAQWASASEVKSAYRAMSVKWHPGRNPNIDITEMMQDINEAYAILKDEEKRRRYDEEYCLCMRQRCQASSCAQDTGAETSGTSRGYEYDYDVQDEVLKEDMQNARAYARRLVEDFMRSFRTASIDAAKGAWSGAKPYVYVFVAMVVIGVLAGICYNAFSDWRETLSSMYAPKTPTVRELPSVAFNPRTGKWKQYSIDSSISISVPKTLELRPIDEFAVSTKTHTPMAFFYGLPCNSDFVIFRQKGLSEAEDKDQHYCRVIVQHIKGNADEYLYSDEVVALDDEMTTTLREIVDAEIDRSKSGYRLLGEPAYDWVSVDNQKAIEIKYRRTGNGGNTTAVTIYLLQNNDEAAKIIVAYREQEQELWLPEMDDVIRTFKWIYKKTDDET